ncbi:LysE family translocator [Actinophytocola sp.]|uniref:LysE family translocator n=1 Tax=Actinophytocola sp. TaxID=1872138 RepID=UPI003D6A8D94
MISLVPGPDMMFIVANAIARGRVAGVVAVSTGMPVHTVAAVLGLGALSQAATVVLEAVRIVGAGFLVYLAIGALRSARSVAETAPARFGGTRCGGTHLMAALTNLANPKVIFFYLAFFPQFVTEGGWATPVQFLIMGAVFIVVGLAVDASVRLAAGTFSALLLGRPAVRRWLNRVSAAIFGGLAVRLVVDR